MLAEVTGGGLTMILKVSEDLSTGLLVGFSQNDHLVAQLGGGPAPHKEREGPLGGRLGGEFGPTRGV